MANPSGTFMFGLALAASLGFAAAMQATAAEEKKEDWTSQGSDVIQDHSASSPSEALFVEKCAMCHRKLGMGTVLLSRRLDPNKAMLEDRDDLNKDYVSTVVRMGLGNMPPISRGEVSDGQLATIAQYLARGDDQ